ncbi:MAG: prepilin-type N-terminal cleavage/methylation domain-containing protein [Actinomycetota bacterium]
MTSRHLDPRTGDARHRQAGFTLTELLMAIALFTLFAGGVYAAFFSGTDATSAQRTALNAQADARAALDRLSRELRQAISPDGGVTAPVASLSATAIAFYSDLDRDPAAGGTRPSLIRYSVTGGVLVREEAAPSGSVPPYTYGAYSAGVVLAEDVRTAVPPFQALTAGGAMLTSPVAQPRDIATVRVTLSLGQRTISQSTTTDLTTDVALRNRLRT